MKRSIGRDAELEEILRRLRRRRDGGQSRTHQVYLAIVGPRRVGVSTLLEDLRDALTSEGGFLPIYAALDAASVAFFLASADASLLLDLLSK